MDVLAVSAATEKAVAQCRADEGPVLLEMMTYRYRGHSMSDPAKYRTREEVSKVRQERDPIEHVRDLLVEAGFADDDSLREVDKAVKAEINDAADFAQNNLPPAADELFTDITVSS